MQVGPDPADEALARVAHRVLADLLGDHGIGGLLARAQQPAVLDQPVELPDHVVLRPAEVAPAERPAVQRVQRHLQDRGGEAGPVDGDPAARLPDALGEAVGERDHPGRGGHPARAAGPLDRSGQIAGGGEPAVQRVVRDGDGLLEGHGPGQRADGLGHRGDGQTAHHHDLLRGQPGHVQVQVAAQPATAGALADQVHPVEPDAPDGQSVQHRRGCVPHDSVRAQLLDRGADEHGVPVLRSAQPFVPGVQVRPGPEADELPPSTHPTDLPVPVPGRQQPRPVHGRVVARHGRDAPGCARVCTTPGRPAVDGRTSLGTTAARRGAVRALDRQARSAGAARSSIQRTLSCRARCGQRTGQGARRLERSATAPSTPSARVSNVLGPSVSASDSSGTTCSRTGNGDSARR